MQPWKLLADPSGYIFSWLLGYSGGLGSIAGVLIADYWIVRRNNLELGDLYREEGRFSYEGKVSWLVRAPIILIFALCGFFIGAIVNRNLAVWIIPLVGSFLDVGGGVGVWIITSIVLVIWAAVVIVFYLIGKVLTRKGSNWRAVLATLLGCFFAWIGLIIPTLRPLYDYAWFVGFGVAFIVHLGLMKASPPRKSQHAVEGQET